MTQLKMEKREGKWSPFKAVSQADKFIENLMVPSIGKELAVDQNLDFPNLMNADNKKLEQFLTMYGGIKMYLETQLADIEATKNALDAAFNESYSTAIYRLAEEREEEGKKKFTRDELRGAVLDKYEALRELRRDVIEQEIVHRKITGLKEAYAQGFSTVSRIVSLRTFGGSNA
tara:strand:- start:24 stop:545 length:522 start_codon:yes stop_codon:yes gene_type:complete